MPIKRRARNSERESILNSQMQTITNTVNCLGVMGKGIALRIKNAHSENFREYESRCMRGEVLPGVPFVLPATPKKNKPNLQLILNFPTKNDWRRPSELAWIDTGLQVLRDNYQEWGITSLALPPLGCGLGGLDWADVWPLIEKHLSQLPIEIEVWVPDGEETDEIVNEEPTLFDI